MRARALFVSLSLTVSVVSVSAQSLPTNSEPPRPIGGFPADARIAYVDLDRVAALSSAGKAAAAKLDDLRNKRASELAERSKQVSALEQKMTQSAAVLNDDARIRMQREYQRARVSFERLRDDAQTEVQDLQEELLRAFTARVFPVIGLRGEGKEALGRVQQGGQPDLAQRGDRPHGGDREAPRRQAAVAPRVTP
jgi:Skp family chaperone for outer membrane proteins